MHAQHAHLLLLRNGLEESRRCPVARSEEELEQVLGLYSALKLTKLGKHLKAGAARL